MHPIVIVLAVIATVAIAAFVLLGNRKRANVREELEAVCTENGWSFGVGTDDTGHVRITTISARSAPWSVEEHFSANSESVATSRWTTWTDPTVAIPSGLAVMNLALESGRAADMERFLDKMGSGVMEKHMVKTFFGAIGEGVHDLEAVSMENAKGLIMATPDARDALEPIAHSEALEGRKVAMPKGANPTLILSPKGLQLRLADTLGSGAQLSELVQLGQTLSAALSDARGGA